MVNGAASDAGVEHQPGLVGMSIAAGRPPRVQSGLPARQQAPHRGLGAKGVDDSVACRTLLKCRCGNRRRTTGPTCAVDGRAAYRVADFTVRLPWPGGSSRFSQRLPSGIATRLPQLKPAKEGRTARGSRCPRTVAHGQRPAVAPGQQHRPRRAWRPVQKGGAEVDPSCIARWSGGRQRSPGRRGPGRGRT